MRSAETWIPDGGIVMPEEKIRESVIAGSWYPGRPDELEEDLEGYLAGAGAVELEGDLVGLIAPHAGYVYSGEVAAHAYRLLRDRPFSRVLILAPSHRAHFPGASIYHLGGYRTPLGVVPLDKELVEALRSRKSLIGYHARGELNEHSLEIQLPFLQAVLKDFSLVPIVMGDQSPDLCSELAEAIAETCEGKGVLLVASSDLSHFHPYEEAVRMDRVVTECVAAYDTEGLAAALRRGDGEACGAGPMLTVMSAARKLGANKSRVLHYANSGDVTGDRHSVVGYMAGVLYADPGAGDGFSARGSRKTGVDLGLSAEEKETLRSIAPGGHQKSLSR